MKLKLKRWRKQSILFTNIPLTENNKTENVIKREHYGISKYSYLIWQRTYTFINNSIKWL